MAPLRFGLGPAGLPWMRTRADRRELIDFCRRAEDAGFSSVGFGDHLDDRPAPLPAIAAVAAHTSTLRLGVMVLCTEFRFPAVLAQEARTLQILTDGRLDLGLGVGWMSRDFAQLDGQARPFTARLEALARSVDTVRAAFPADRDVPCPPIVIGGGGRAMLRAAARLADIVTLNIPLRAGAGVSANSIVTIGEHGAVRERIDLVRAERPDAELHLMVHEVHVGDDWRRFAEARATALGMTAEALLASPHVFVGSVAGLADTITQRAEHDGIRSWHMSGAALDMMRPVLARLAVA